MAHKKVFLNKIQEMLDSPSYSIYEQDKINCLEGWQYSEPAYLSVENRYELDVEAYKDTFHSKSHDIGIGFDERLLLEKLIINLSKARHPTFIVYRKFLVGHLALLKNTKKNTSEPTYNTQIFKSRSGFNFFETLQAEFKTEIERTPLAYYSFIYWKMKKDDFLYNISPKVFLEFLNDKPYSLKLDKIKTLPACSTHSKNSRYLNCRRPFTNK